MTEFSFDAFDRLVDDFLAFDDAAERTLRTIDGVAFDESGATLVRFPPTKSGQYVVPNGVRSIDDSAFRGCASLTEIAFPETLETIGAFAFCDCSSLTEIALPKSLKTIGAFAFCDCSSLTEIRLPQSLETLGEGAFDGVSSLTTIVVDAANRNFRSVDDVLLGDVGTTLIKAAPKKRGRLVVPNGVRTVEPFAFYACSELTEIWLPQSLETLRESELADCSSLTSVVVDGENRNFRSVDGVLYDKDGATLLRTPPKKSGAFVVPNGVRKIGDSAFCGCASTTEIRLPASLETFGERAFAGCETLASFVVDGANPRFRSVDGVAFDRAGTTLVRTPPARNGRFVVPNGVRAIGAEAFYECRSLTEIRFPDSLEQIGRAAFCECRSLTDVRFPDSLQRIGADAFSFCASLTEIKIPEGLKSFGSGAFSACESLAKVGLPASWTEIPDFAFCGDSALTTIGALESLELLGRYAFSGCSALTELRFSEALEYVDDDAFDDCDALTIVAPPDSYVWLVAEEARIPRKASGV